MTSTRPHQAFLVALGIALVVIGVLTSRSDASAFGLSSQFFGGFLIGLGIVFETFGVALAMGSSAPAR